MGTIMKSKEENVLELFFNSPTKHWHFEEIIKESNIVRSKGNIWLKKFVSGGLIKKINKKGQMPYYVSRYDCYEYKFKKKIFALNKLHQSGFLNHLSSLNKVNSIIIFGSFARSDWYKDSDIDVFIYGSAEGLKIVDYELKLNRDIQLFICKNQKELNMLGEGLIKNIIKGNLIKGNLDFMGVHINA